MALELRKLYRVLPDEEAEARGQLRVIAESREDYLYPQIFVMPVSLSDSVRKAVEAAA